MLVVAAAFASCPKPSLILHNAPHLPPTYPPVAPLGTGRRHARDCLEWILVRKPHLGGIPLPSHLPPTHIIIWERVSRDWGLREMRHIPLGDAASSVTRLSWLVSRGFRASP